MPNWCSNSIEISGDKADVKALTDLLKTGQGTGLDFNLFIPYPEKFAVADKITHEAFEKEKARAKASNDDINWDVIPKDGYNSGGYEWCCSNWGTKWNAMDALVDIDKHGGAVTIEMDTAWSPPIPVIAKMAEMFPKLNISMLYEEAGMGFAGGVWFENGELVDSEEHNLEMEEEEWEEEGS